MSPSSSLAVSFYELLGKEIQEASAFISLLQEEQAFLVVGNVEALMPLVEKKTGFATRLGSLSQLREQTLTANGLTPDRAGMEAFIAKPPSHRELRARWEKLLVLAVEARELNELNGKLIRLHLQHNQDALNTLLAAANRATTYGPDGQQRGMSGGRFLGSA